MQRLKWVDCAKGVSILLVALGHSPADFLDYEYLQWLRSFRVPFFFFISGIFLSGSLTTSEFSKKRFKSLIIPYLTGGAIAIIGSSLLSGQNLFNIKWVGLFYGEFHYLEWGPIWFLPQLFLVSIISHSLIIKCRLRECLGVCTVPLIIAVLILWAGILEYVWVIPIEFNGKNYDILGWPFGFDLTIINTCFFVLGFCFSNYLKSDYEEKNFKLITFIAVLFLFNLLFNESTLNLAVRRYDHPLFSTLSAIISIAFIITVIKIISKKIIFADSLAFFGKFSLLILIFHEVVQRRVFNVLFELGYSENLAGVIAFSFGVVVPIVFQLGLARRFKITSVLFSVDHKPYSFIRNIKH